MNITSTTNSTSIDLEEYYKQKKLQKEKLEAQLENQEQLENQIKLKQEKNDLIEISEEAFSSLNSNAQNKPEGSILSSLVDDGTLSEEQLSAVESVLQGGNNRNIQPSGTYGSNMRPQSPLDSLVSSGVITEEEKQAIQDKLMSSLKPSNKEEEVKQNPLDKLVEDGTITEEQKDAIIKALDPQNREEEDEIKTNPLDELVENGVITQDQQNAIIKALDMQENSSFDYLTTLLSNYKVSEE